MVGFATWVSWVNNLLTALVIRFERGAGQVVSKRFLGCGVQKPLWQVVDGHKKVPDRWPCCRPAFIVGGCAGRELPRCC